MLEGISERAMVIALQNADMELNHLKSLLQTKMKHSYLEKYIQKPVINEEKLFVLHAILNNINMPVKKKEKYMITTMLVQIALDTHDLVTDKKNDTVEPLSVESTRQLTVLAGDYYSGLYYLLLAEIEDYQLIHALAIAIKEINELKMRLYYQEFMSFDEFTHLVKKVESLLFTHFAHHINDDSLHSMIEDWLLLDRLITDQKLMIRGLSPRIKIWLQDYSQQTIDAYVNEQIERTIARLEKSLCQIPPHHRLMRERMTTFLNQLPYENTSIAEEG